MADSAVVMSATLESMTALATRLAYLSCFSCSTGSPLLMTGPPKETQSRKSLKPSFLGVWPGFCRAGLGIGDEPQQEQRALDAPVFSKSTVERAGGVVGAELTQEDRGGAPPRLDR